MRNCYKFMEYIEHLICNSAGYHNEQLHTPEAIARPYKRKIYPAYLYYCEYHIEKKREIKLLVNGEMNDVLIVHQSC